MRTLYFEMISDNRFTKDIVKDNTNKVASLLSILPEEVDHSVEYYPANFPDGTKQIRAKIMIQKNSRKITWNDIYKIINSINPCVYKFTDMEQF